MVAVFAGLALWRALDSETALGWAVNRALQAAGPDRLSIEGLSGSLAQGMHARRVRWRDNPAAPTLSIEATEVDVYLSVRGLLQRRLVLAGLSARSMLIEAAEGKDESATLPRTLALPIELAISDARVDRLEVVRAAQRYVATKLSLDYEGGASGHRIEKLTGVLDQAAGRAIGAGLSLAGRIAGAPPFALDAKLATRGGTWFPSPAAETIDGQLQATGSLQSPHVIADLTVLGAALKAEAALAPFAATAPERLQRLDAQIKGLDLERVGRALAQPLPEALLDAQLLHARYDKDGVFSGDVRLSNGRAGAAAERRVPVSAASAALRLRPSGDFDLDKLKADMAPTGQVQGGVHWIGGTLKANLALAGVSQRAIASRLNDVRWSGKVEATDANKVQQATVDLSGTGLAKLAPAIQGPLRLAGKATLANERLRLEQLQFALGAGRASLDGELQLAGEQSFKATARLAGVDPAALGSFPKALLNATLDADGKLKAKGSVSWQTRVRVQFTDSRLFDRPLSGRAQADLDARSAQRIDAALSLGKNTVAANGALAWAGPGAETRLNLRAGVPELQQFDPRFQGAVDAEAELRGTLRAPAGKLSLRAKELVTNLGSRGVRVANADVAATLEAATRATLRVAASEIVVSDPVSGNFAWTQPRAALEGRRIANSMAAAAATERTALLNDWLNDAWTGTLTALQAGGAWPMRLTAPATFKLGATDTQGRRSLSLASLNMDVVGGQARVAELDWGPGQLRTRGELAALPVSPFLAVLNKPFAPSSTLKLDGQWRFDNLLAGTAGSADIQIQRRSGDLTLSTGDKYALGLSELRLAAHGGGGSAKQGQAAAGQTIALDMRLASALLGNVTASGRVTPPANADETLMNTALAVTAQLDLPNLRGLTSLADNSAADIGGRAHAEFRAAGTLAEPQLTGELSMDGLRITAPPQGIDLRDGSLRATLEGRTLTLKSFTMAGPAGRLSATGRLPLSSLGGGQGGPSADLQAGNVAWKAEGLQLLNRPDRRARISGEGSVSFEPGADSKAAPLLTLRGKVSVDQGRFDFDRGERVALGDDVHIVGGKDPRKPDARASLPRIAVDLDLATGEQISVIGAGLDARLAGNVRISGRADVALGARGRLHVTSGTYLLAGQKLTIERGDLIFDGPLDNPALDILVLRKNLPVEAGAQISGTARVPSVQLVSTPPVPDGEKLAWIVLGRGLDAAGGADLGLLQAAVGLVGSNRAPLTQRVARNVGLDDISFRSTEAGQNALALGKRLSDRLYVEVEQGLQVASSLLRLNFVLSRTVTARIEAGSTAGTATGGVGLYYRRSFE